MHPIARDEIQSVENRLVVALFRGSVGKVILQKVYPQIIKVTLADINGDGAPELAVQWSDGALISPAFWLDIWRVNGEGMIAPVDLTNIRSGMDQEMASHGNTMELGDYTVGDLSIYSEQTVVKENEAIDMIRKQYTWNNEKATYEFKSKTIIEEKILNRLNMVNQRAGGSFVCFIAKNNFYLKSLVYPTFAAWGRLCDPDEGSYAKRLFCSDFA